ncbi:MAG TPA: hypothetical protein PLD91_13440 [Spirochaetota bacterium]|nr:hypothetical protein [Spirochaetota bacterium]HQJ71733.1 hypothetical protein [Spirochaetota bacterium]HRS77001.1 hypothetical protein [Spirochaetota bacterium]HRT75852.1 hypothetical protein [Spirochaetota bacterium]
MKPIRQSFIICVVIIVTAAPHAYAENASGQERKKGMVGAATAGIAVAVEAEYRFIRPLAIRFTGVYVYGLNSEKSPIVTKGENLFTAVLTPAVYIPTPVDFLDPVFFFGVSYSHYRWKSPDFRMNGIINDVTFGGGAGLGFIVAPFCRIGVNCWINYDYKINTEYGMKKKGHRIPLPLPFIDVCFMF